MRCCNNFNKVILRRTFLIKVGTLTLGSTISLLLPSPVSNAQNLVKPKHLEDALELLYGLDSHRLTLTQS